MKINKIIKQSKNKYKIILEEKEFIVYEDLLIKYNILTSKNIDETLLKKIEKENTFYEVYEKALKYLDIKMRLEYELISYLKRSYDIKIVEKVIEKLKKENLINDNKYVKAYINDKIALSSDGPYKIKRDLINKGIDESIINIDDIDINLIEEKLRKLIIKYSNINKNNSKSVIKTKVINYFIMQGFDKEMIISIFDSLNIEGNNDKIITEYNKLNQKYSKKYSGYKLDSTIKQKLFQKGYLIDEINNIK